MVPQPKHLEVNIESAMLVGDTHGDVQWLYEHVLPNARRQGVEAVIQLGDFGYWPSARSFLKVARQSRANFGVDVYFIDGNHEHFPMLSRDVGEALRRRRIEVPAEPLWYHHPVELSPGFVYLPRGSRLTVAGRATVCIGGAASVNRAFLIDRETWFFEERTTDADVDAAIKDGPADLLLCHDAPAQVEVPKPATVGAPIAWLHESEVAVANRRRLGRVVSAVRPTEIVHGHFHYPYHAETSIEPDSGPQYLAQIYGLGRNEQRPLGLVLRVGEEPVVVETRSKGAP